MPKTNKPDPKSNQPKDDQPLVVRPERNLDRFPAIWTPFNARPSKIAAKVIEYEHDTGNKIIKGRLEIIPAVRKEGDKLLLEPLTTFDQLVFLALVKTWEEQGAKDDYTFLSLRQLAKDLVISWGQKTITTLTNSLFRLNRAELNWTQFITKKGTEKTFEVIEPMRILTEIKIIKRKGENGEVIKDKGYFRFHSAVLNNLKANYTRPLLFNIVRSFKSEVAQLIYTYADRVLAYGTVHERRSENLFVDIGLESKEYRYASNRKRILEKAIAELNGKLLSSGGVLKVTIAEAKDKSKKPDYKLIFEKKARLAIAPTVTADPPAEEKPATKPAKEPSEAEQLVFYFHQIFFGKSAVAAGKKELEHAKRLIAVHGFEAAKAVIEGAKREAPKTNFDIQTFGGVMQYQARALADAEAAKERTATKTASVQAPTTDESQADSWDTHFEDYAAFANAELSAIQDQHPEAFAKFEEKLKDHLKIFEQFDLSERARLEVVFEHANWFFNQTFFAKYKIPFVTFSEWDKGRRGAQEENPA